MNQFGLESFKKFTLEDSLGGRWASETSVQSVQQVGRMRAGVVEAVMEGPFGAKAVLGIVGDRQGPGLSSTARDELGEIRYGAMPWARGTPSVLCGLCGGQLKNLIQTRLPALRLLRCSLPIPTLLAVLPQ